MATTRSAMPAPLIRIITGQVRPLFHLANSVMTGRQPAQALAYDFQTASVSPDITITEQKGLSVCRVLPIHIRMNAANMSVKHAQATLLRLQPVAKGQTAFANAATIGLKGPHREGDVYHAQTLPSKRLLEMKSARSALSTRQHLPTAHRVNATQDILVDRFRNLMADARLVKPTPTSRFPTEPTSHIVLNAQQMLFLV